MVNGSLVNEMTEIQNQMMGVVPHAQLSLDSSAPEVQLLAKTPELRYEEMEKIMDQTSVKMVISLMVMAEAHLENMKHDMHEQAGHQQALTHASLNIFLLLSLL